MTSTPANYVNFSTFANKGRLTQLTDGNFLLLWTNDSEEQSASLYGQVFKTDGSTLLDKFEIYAAQATHISDFSATTLTDGRTIVSFATYDETNNTSLIGARILDTHYSLAGNLLQLSKPEATFVSAPQTFALSDGGFSTLYSGTIGNADGIYNSIWRPSATNGWSSSYYFTDFASSDTKSYSVLSDGSYVLVTVGTNGVGDTLKLYAWEPNATSPGEANLPAPVQIDTMPGLENSHPAIAALDANTFVVAWEDTTGTTGGVIRARVFDKTGRPAGADVTFSKAYGRLEELVVTKLTNGGFAIAFSMKESPADDIDYNIYVAASDATGTAVTDTIAVGASTIGDQKHPSIVALANGGYAVSWMNDGNAEDKLVTQVFGHSGPVIDPTPTTPTTPANPTTPTTEVDDILFGTAIGETLNGYGGNDKLFGYGGNDVLSGGDGNDTLHGGVGNDKLYGDAGMDIFVFDTKLNKSKNIDKIVKFNVKDDTIYLAKSIFTKLKAGKLKKDAFFIGNKAHDGSDKIIYDKKSGKLFYDADGTGKQQQIQFATLDKNLKMTEKDFFVV